MNNGNRRNWEREKLYFLHQKEIVLMKEKDILLKRLSELDKKLWRPKKSKPSYSIWEYMKKMMAIGRRICLKVLGGLLMKNLRMGTLGIFRVVQCLGTFIETWEKCWRTI